MLFSRLWALSTGAAFFLLWLLSQTPQLSNALGNRLVGIWGWGLVAAGFFGVALANALARRPKKPRRLVRVAAAPQRPRRLPRSPYTPRGRRFRQNVQRRFYGRCSHHT